MPDVQKVKNTICKNEPLAAARRRSRSASICSRLKIFSIIGQRLQDLRGCLYNRHFYVVYPFIEDNDQTLARREHLELCVRSSATSIRTNSSAAEIVDPEKEDTITAIVEKFRASNQASAEGRLAEDLEQANSS